MLLKNLKFVLGLVENIVGKGENAGYQYFLLFPQCFQKASMLNTLWRYMKVAFNKSDKTLLWIDSLCYLTQNVP